MTPPRRSRRKRPWWRSRRALAAVVLIDAIGAIAIVIALTHHTGGGHARPAALVTETATVHSVTPTVGVTHERQRRPASPIARRGRHRRRRPTRVPASSPSLPRAPLPAGAAAGFARVASMEPGAVGLAIAPLGAGRIHTFGSLQQDDAWSTMKVPVLTTLLRDTAASDQHISGALARDATLALEQSDNTAVNALFAALESRDDGLVGASADLQRTLQAAGDGSTAVNTAANDEGFSTFGQTQWAASGEVDFYRSLARGCLLSNGDTSWVLALMSRVEPYQRWGAGEAGFAAGTPLMFKGGWGPEQGGGYLVRQTAIVGAGDRGWVFSMLARPSDGSFASGTAMLTRLATWVAGAFPATQRSPSRACR